MKSIKTLFGILFLTLVMISCSKNDDGGGGSGDGSMTAKVDGASFTADLAVQATLSGGVLAFGGTGSNGQITIAIPGYSSPGTFNIGTTAATATYATTSGTITGYTASMVIGSGSITISELSGGYVKGSFSFTAFSSGGATSKTITDGQFNIKLQ